MTSIERRLYRKYREIHQELAKLIALNFYLNLKNLTAPIMKFKYYKGPSDIGVLHLGISDPYWVECLPHVQNFLPRSMQRLAYIKASSCLLEMNYPLR